MNVNSLIKKVFLLLAWVAMALTLVACPPQMQCDEKIEDPQDYQSKVLSNLVIEQINRQLHILQVGVSCRVSQHREHFGGPGIAGRSVTTS